jgi:1-phosphofructokinase
MIYNRVAAITLHPEINQTVFVSNLTFGQANRVEFEQFDPGGRAVHVASYLSDFAIPVYVTGFLGVDNAEIFQSFCAQKKIEDRFIRIPGRTRANLKIVDRATQVMTDLNNPAVVLTEEEPERLIRVVEDLAQRCNWFVLSGEMSSESDSKICNDVIALLKGHDKNILLDTNWIGQQQGTNQVPDVVKVTIQESPDSFDSVIADVRQLLKRGVRTAIISTPERGIVLLDEEKTVIAHPPAIEAKNTGEGADVAGFIIGQLRALSLEDCARLSTACAIGAASQRALHLPPVDVVEALMEKVKVDVI